MDNDTLINQARHLYAVLLIKRYMLPSENDTKIARFDNLIELAYCRYVRRLNRCVLCYQQRSYDCNREPGKNHTPCKKHYIPRA